MCHERTPNPRGRKSRSGGPGGNAPQPGQQTGNEMGGVSEPRPRTPTPGPSSVSCSGTQEHVEAGAGAASGLARRSLMEIRARWFREYDGRNDTGRLREEVQAIVSYFGVFMLLSELREVCMENARKEYAVHHRSHGDLWFKLAEDVNSLQIKAAEQYL